MLKYQQCILQLAQSFVSSASRGWIADCALFMLSEGQTGLPCARYWGSLVQSPSPFLSLHCARMLFALSECLASIFPLSQWGGAFQGERFVYRVVSFSLSQFCPERGEEEKRDKASHSLLLRRVSRTIWYLGNIQCWDRLTYFQWVSTSTVFVSKNTKEASM